MRSCLIIVLCGKTGAGVSYSAVLVMSSNFIPFLTLCPDLGSGPTQELLLPKSWLSPHFHCWGEAQSLEAG